jgi:hypothetical protein
MQMLQEQLKKVTEENKQLSDKRQVAMAQIQERKEAAQLDAQLAQQKMMMDNQVKEQELIWKTKMSDADRAAKLLELQTRYDTELAKLKSKDELERDLAEFKVQAEVSLEERKLEAAHRDNVIQMESRRGKDDLDSQVSNQLTQALESIQDLSEGLKALQEMAKDAETRRNAVLSYISKNGDKDTQALARKLQE